MAIGLVGVVLGAAQLKFVGPIAYALGGKFGMDVGFELGVIFAAITYFILRRIEINTSPRGEVGAGGK